MVDWSNPTTAAIAGGLAGGLIGVLGTLVVSFFSRRAEREENTHQISVLRSPPKEIVSKNIPLQKPLKISIGEEDVEQINMYEFVIKNTGMKVLENLTFNFEAGFGEYIVEYKLDTNPHIDGVSFSRYEGDYKLKLSVPYMNKRDLLKIRIVSSSPPEEFKADFRNKGVYEKPMSLDSLNDFSRALMEAIARTALIR
jgi:hypothetical protein